MKFLISDKSPYGKIIVNAEICNCRRLKRIDSTLDNTEEDK